MFGGLLESQRWRLAFLLCDLRDDWAGVCWDEYYFP